MLQQFIRIPDRFKIEDLYPGTNSPGIGFIKMCKNILDAILRGIPHRKNTVEF